MTSGTTNPGTQQKASSGLLGLFIFASFVLAQAGALLIHPQLDLYGQEGFLVADGFGLALTIVFGIINMANTFATNLDWKSYIGFFVIIYNVAFAALYISQGA
jgi:hypothetical protein